MTTPTSTGANAAAAGGVWSFGPDETPAATPAGNHWGDVAPGTGRGPNGEVVAPGGRTAPTRGGGGGVEYVEFGDLAAVRRFAAEIDSLGDGSDFVLVIKACHGLADAIRDFGGDMNLRTRAFVDTAIAVATSGDALRDEAAIVARLSKDLDGGE